MGNTSDEDKQIIPESFTVINDRPLRELLIQELREGQTQIPTESCELPWTPARLEGPYFIRDRNQNKLEIEWLRIMVKIDIAFFVGKANEFPDFITHLQHSDKKIRIVVPAKFRLGFGKQIARYKKKSDIPVHASEAFPCMLLPETDSPEIIDPKLYIITPIEAV